MRVPNYVSRTSLVLLFCAASVATASAADKAEFIKKPKYQGAEESRVSTFKADSAGVINCSAKCFTNGQTYHWTCKKGQGNEIIHCTLNCNPPRGSCTIE